MFQPLRQFVTALAICVAMLIDNMAQAQAPRPTADGQPAYRAKQVIGAKVSIQGNIVIGTVDDIIFADDGYVEYLTVVNDGKLVTVPWQAAQFNFEQRTAVVNITSEQFRVIPTFTVERYPAFFAPTFRTEIYKHFGLGPPPDRKLNPKKK